MKVEFILDAFNLEVVVKDVRTYANGFIAKTQSLLSSRIGSRRSRSHSICHLYYGHRCVPTQMAWETKS